MSQGMTASEVAQAGSARGRHQSGARPSRELRRGPDRSDPVLDRRLVFDLPGCDLLRHATRCAVHFEHYPQSFPGVAMTLWAACGPAGGAGRSIAGRRAGVDRLRGRVRPHRRGFGGSLPSQVVRAVHVGFLLPPRLRAWSANFTAEAMSAARSAGRIGVAGFAVRALSMGSSMPT